MEISFCKQQDQEDEGTAVLSASNLFPGNLCVFFQGIRPISPLNSGNEM